MSPPPRRASDLSYATDVVVLAAVYMVTATLGHTLGPASGAAGLLQPATGIMVAALLRFGLRLWPGVTLGAFLAHAGTAGPLVALAIAATDTVGAMLGAAALERTRVDPRLRRVADVVAVLVVVLCTSFVQAALATGCLYAVGAAPLALRDHAVARWLGDMSGTLVAVFVLMSWTNPQRDDGSRGVEPWALTVTLVSSCVFTFWSPWPAHSGPALVLVLATLAWSSVRLSPRAVSALVLVASALALAATAVHRGPFEALAPLPRLAATHANNVVIAVVALSLAAATREREEAHRAALRALARRADSLTIAGHELRTPLTAVSLLQERLRAILGEPHKPRELALEKLERAIVHTERMSQLITRLLDVSRMTRGTFAVERRYTDLDQVVRDVVLRLDVEARQSRCRVTRVSRGGVYGHWDALRLDQLIANLLENAIRHAPGRPIEVRLAADASIARIAVSDGGDGIDERALRTLFDPFRRGPTSKGLGLGLYIARSIARAHGGSLVVESSATNGTTFTVDLPLAAPDLVAERDGARAPSAQETSLFEGLLPSPRELLDSRPSDPFS